MHSLDPRSLIVLAGLMAVVMAVVLAFIRRQYPAHIRGLGLWAAAPVSWLVSAALYAGRDSLPASVSVVGANTALALGALLYYAGCRQFLARQMHWRWWALLLAGAAAALWWLVQVRDDYTLRLQLFNLLMIFIYGTNLRFLLRHDTARLPMRMVQLVLGAHIAVLIFRLYTTMNGMAGSGLLEQTLPQTFYIGAYALTVLMLSIGAVLMATDRLVSELDHLARHDPLTHTLNRRALFEHCEEELARALRSGKGPALLMLDIDHFKRINDSHGHQHGDSVLRHLAQSVQSVLRRTDRLGRYGGEEFMLLLPETGLADARAIAQRIHQANAGGHALDCRVSMGLTVWQGKQDTLQAMQTRADGALYQAKEHGRNQTCIA